MLRGATIICLAPIDWTFNWQLPQEVASAFAASGNRVLFVENTGVRRPLVRDAARLRARFTNWRRGVKTVREGLDVFSPLLLPLPYSRLAGMLNGQIMRRAVRRWLGRNRSKTLIVITFLPTPLARNLIRALRPALVVYYCADRIAQSSPGARRVQSSEREFLAEAGLVLVTSPGLQAMAEEQAARVEFLPCGVRASDFERAARERTPESGSAMFRDLSRPIVGFAGTLRNELDLAMLAEMAELAPDINFVFAGPALADLSRLAALPNVTIIGALPHPEVIRHVVHFDAGMLPYVQTVFTADVMPAKLKEY
ncbi:MAG TPA: hypothetical protein VF911_01920, partial [Thermoanaerobaculia bacterium]